LSFKLQTLAVETEQTFQAPASPSECFWLRTSKMAFGPAPQPWFTDLHEVMFAAWNLFKKWQARSLPTVWSWQTT